jgi:hypothetical protein
MERTVAKNAAGLFLQLFNFKKLLYSFLLTIPFNNITHCPIILLFSKVLSPDS